MKPLLFSFLIVSLLLGACKKDIQNEDAVRRGIMKHLSKRQDLTSMDITVTKVAFRQNEADATVHFQAKNSTQPGTGLDLSYVLERNGNEWVVKGKPAGSHGASSMPAMPGMPGPENPLGMGAPPTGAPQTGAMPGSLPPGHPSIQPKTQPKSTGPEK